MQFVLFLLSFFLVGCHAHHSPIARSEDSLVRGQHIVDVPAGAGSSQSPVFVRMSNYSLNQPREDELRQLGQIVQLLSQAQALAVQAQTEADQTQRVIFDYPALLLDLQAVSHGLNQHFLTDIRAPRLPTRVNEHPVRGQYTRVGH